MDFVCGQYTVASLSIFTYEKNENKITAKNRTLQEHRIKQFHLFAVYENSHILLTNLTGNNLQTDENFSFIY